MSTSRSLTYNDPNSVKTGELYVTAYKHVSALTLINENGKERLVQHRKNIIKFVEHEYVTILKIVSDRNYYHVPVAHVMSSMGPCWLLLADLIKVPSKDQDKEEKYSVQE